MRLYAKTLRSHLMYGVDRTPMLGLISFDARAVFAPTLSAIEAENRRAKLHIVEGGQP